MARNKPIKRKAAGSSRKAKATRRKAQRRGNRRHSSVEKEPIEIPLPLLKFGIGAFLLPVAWVLTVAILRVFDDGESTSLWSSAELVFFSIGFGLWSACFFLFPRPTKLYVFGHELTHAIFVIFCFGKVKGFKVADEGGYIISNKTNFLISLSPYFVPIYTVFSLCLLASINWLTPLPWLDRILFFATGVTWGFHITFTLSMIQRGQSDLEENGVFFSGVLIYLLNLAQISLLLIMASRDVSLADYGRACLFSAGEFSNLLLRALNIQI